MIRVVSDTRVPIKMWVTDLEASAEQQARNLAELPFIFKHVALMPDAHWGKGSTVGSVIATQGAIIPAAVGVDIGCGMCAVRLPFKIDEIDRLPELRHSIERSVPVGHNVNSEVTNAALEAYDSLGKLSDTATENLETRTLAKAIQSIGSLGGGNHFIEICGDESNQAWIMLHSGSRNIGKCLAELHINQAKDLMKDFFIDTWLKDPDLAYFTQNSDGFQEYIKDLMWAQGFAKANRNEMMKRILKDVFFHVYKDKAHHSIAMADSLFRVDCHHNYTAIENHFGKNIYVTRKGAVSARKDEWGIIPGSMGTRSYIVKGLGNEESFCSCSHGAGRRMSRGQARKQFTIKDLENATAGVECRKDVDVIDEIPGAYKDIDVVMENQKDLVVPAFTLKQILCVKG